MILGGNHSRTFHLSITQFSLVLAYSPYGCLAATPASTTDAAFTVDSFGSASSTVLYTGPSKVPDFMNGSAEYRIAVPPIGPDLVNFSLSVGQTVSITAVTNAYDSSDYCFVEGAASLFVVGISGALSVQYPRQDLFTF